MGKGGGSTTSTGTTYTTNLPEYARPYYERLAERAEEESLRPYTPYEDQRIAGTTADTERAYDITRSLAQRGTPGIDQAGQVAAQAAGYQMGPGAAGVRDYYSGYRAGPGAQGLATYQSGYQAGAGPDAEQFQAQDWTQADRQAYQDPYIQDVLRQQEQMAQRRFGEQQAARDAAAVQAGAFGGDRRFVQDALAQRDINEQMNLMQAQGLSQAYQSAQEAFAADQARQAQAAGVRLSGYQARQQAGQAEEQARAAAAGLRLEDYRAQEQARQAQEAARLEAAKLRLSEFGTREGLGQEAAQLRLSAGEQLAGLDAARQQQRLQQAQALQQIGAQQEARTQQGLDLAYQDFINQRDQPRQQLAFFSQILQGMPVTPQQEVVQRQAAPNQFSQALGLGIGGYSLMNLLGQQ